MILTTLDGFRGDAVLLILHPEGVRLEGLSLNLNVQK